MEEMWKTIEELPNYEVSNFGVVRKIGGGSVVAQSVANGGTMFVKLIRDGAVYSRSVKLLVANAFVPKPIGQDSDLFDTPIQCVVDTKEIRSDKIMWRPRWFAVRYRRQLNHQPYYWDIPVMNLDTNNQHASILTACLRDGVLMEDIYRSAVEGRRVFPTRHRYEFMYRIENDLGSVHEER